MHIKWSKPQHYLPQTVNRQLDRINSLAMFDAIPNEKPIQMPTNRHTDRQYSA